MIRRLFLAVMLLSLCLMATPLSATAFDPFGNPSNAGVNCSGDASSSAICTNKVSSDPNTLDANNPISGSNGLLLKITNIVAIAGGAAAIILIIISGLRYITANGDNNAISSAKSTIVGAVIGLAIIVLAYSLIKFVVSSL